MDNIDELFLSYNKVVEKAYDRVIAESEKHIGKGIGYDAENLRRYTEEAAAKWEGDVLEGLGGMSPVQYIEKYGSLEELLYMFTKAPIICDGELPEIYIEKLKSYGEQATDVLIKLAGNAEMMFIEDESFLIPLMAVKLLGDWKIAGAVPKLIDILDMRGTNFDIFAERVKASLVSIGAPAIEFIISSIESRDVNDTSVEYLLMSLAEIGRNNKSEKIYKCLKNTFHAMDEKVIGALCLKSYADGRAVPALRSFLERNKEKLERDSYYEIVSAIKALGGSIEGL